MENENLGVQLADSSMVCYKNAHEIHVWMYCNQLV